MARWAGTVLPFSDPSPLQLGRCTTVSRGMETTLALSCFSLMCSTIAVSERAPPSFLPYFAFAPARLSEPSTSMSMEPSGVSSGRSAPRAALMSTPDMLPSSLK